MNDCGRGAEGVDPFIILRVRAPGIKVESQECVYVVGSGPLLGDWVENKALPLATSTKLFPVWTTQPLYLKKNDVTLNSSFDYKFYRRKWVDKDGDSEGRGATTWEPIAARTGKMPGENPMIFENMFGSTKRCAPKFATDADVDDCTDAWSESESRGLGSFCPLAIDDYENQQKTAKKSSWFSFSFRGDTLSLPVSVPGDTRTRSTSFLDWMLGSASENQSIANTTPLARAASAAVPLTSLAVPTDTPEDTLQDAVPVVKIQNADLKPVQDPQIIVVQIHNDHAQSSVIAEKSHNEIPRTVISHDCTNTPIQEKFASSVSNVALDRSAAQRAAKSTTEAKSDVEVDVHLARPTNETNLKDSGPQRSLVSDHSDCSSYVPYPNKMISDYKSYVPQRSPMSACEPIFRVPNYTFSSVPPYSANATDKRSQMQHSWVSFARKSIINATSSIIDLLNMKDDSDVEDDDADHESVHSGKSYNGTMMVEGVVVHTDTPPSSSGLNKNDIRKDKACVDAQGVQSKVVRCVDIQGTSPQTTAAECDFSIEGTHRYRR